MASAFTHERYGHVFPGIDKGAAAKLDRVRRDRVTRDEKEIWLREPMTLLWQ